MKISIRAALLSAAAFPIALSAWDAAAGDRHEGRRLHLSGSLSDISEGLAGGSTALSAGGGSGVPYTGRAATEAAPHRADYNSPLSPGANPRAVWTGGSNTTWYEQ